MKSVQQLQVPADQLRTQLLRNSLCFQKTQDAIGKMMDVMDESSALFADAAKGANESIINS